MKTTTRVLSNVQQAAEFLRREGFKPLLSGESAGRIWKRVRDGTLSTAEITPEGQKMRVRISTPTEDTNRVEEKPPVRRPLTASDMPQPIRKVS